jgi:hypothetical protein
MVFRGLIAAVLLASCGPTMNPADAYDLEMRQCKHEGEAEAVRRCESMVMKKYGRFLNEGNYP